MGVRVITRIKANLSSAELDLTSQLELSLAKFPYLFYHTSNLTHKHVLKTTNFLKEKYEFLVIFIAHLDQELIRLDLGLRLITKIVLDNNTNPPPSTHPSQTFRALLGMVECWDSVC